MKASGFFRVKLDGKDVTIGIRRRSQIPSLAAFISKRASRLQLQCPIRAGRAGNASGRAWSGRRSICKPQPAAIEAAKNADVVIAVVGITSELEGEEMQVQRSRASKAATAPASICPSPKKTWSKRSAQPASRWWSS